MAKDLSHILAHPPGSHPDLEPAGPSLPWEHTVLTDEAHVITPVLDREH